MNFYAEVLAGPNFVQKIVVDGNSSTYQTGYIVGGAVGWFWTMGLSLEAEYAYRRNSISTIYFFGQGSSNNGYFQTSSWMANLLWNLPLPSCNCSFFNIEPYVGAGIGCDFQKMKSSNSQILFRQKWTHLSWQVMVGLARPIFSNTAISLDYTFHQGGCHFYNHSLEVGLTYKFGVCRNRR
ncbi:MAG: outer membrane beta-barrel protein [Verrucomicrobia bacterium]|nr:outer membrane beta-barrel protein [Verrucomicrobiota bacterium]